jgi:hypothetical protein
MNDSIQQIVTTSFVVDAFLSFNGRMPRDVDEFEACIETIDIDVLTKVYYPGWELATQARDIIDADGAESGQYKAFILSVVAQAN